MSGMWSLCNCFSRTTADLHAHARAVVRLCVLTACDVNASAGYACLGCGVLCLMSLSASMTTAVEGAVDSSCSFGDVLLRAWLNAGSWLMTHDSAADPATDSRAPLCGVGDVTCRPAGTSASFPASPVRRPTSDSSICRNPGECSLRPQNVGSHVRLEMPLSEFESPAHDAGHCATVWGRLCFAWPCGATRARRMYLYPGRTQHALPSCPADRL